MTRPQALLRTGLSLLLLAAGQPAYGMGQWPEPTLDEAAKDTLTSFEGTVTGFNLESEPPVIRLVSKHTGKTYVFAMNHRTTSVWFEEKLRRVRYLKLGDEVKMFFVVRDRKGLVTSIEILKRAPKPKPATAEDNLMEGLKSLKRRTPPPKAPAAPIMPKGAGTSGAPSAPVVIQRPPMPTTTTERRVH